jgi:hypothetical protein
MPKLILVLIALSTLAFAQDSSIQTLTVTLSAAQLQALRDTPVTLVPPPGRGLAINAISATVQYNFGTEHYAGGHGRFIITLGSYDSDSPISPFDAILTSGFTDQDSNQTVTLQANPIDPSTSIGNLDLEVVNFGPPLIDGDGTVAITINYSIVPTQ